MYKSFILIALLSGSIVALSAAESKASLSFGGGGFTTTPAQCQDGKDNDGNDGGKIDYPADPGCTKLTDNSEGSEGSSTAALTLSATTLAVSPLNALYPVLCGEGTGVDCPRDLECSAFGKQAKGGTKFDNELTCTLDNVTLGVRCNNRADNAPTANFNSAHVADGLLESTSAIQDIDNKGKWAAVTTILGSDLYYLATVLFPASICPNEQNWYVDYSEATVLQADVTEETYQNNVLQNTLDLGTCVLTDYVTGTYSCQ